MTGRQSVDQCRSFHDFCVKDHVPVDYRLRGIGGSLHLVEVRRQLTPHLRHDAATGSMPRPRCAPES